MVATVKNMEYLLNQISTYVSKSTEVEMSRKLNLKKWSKKEILGHLVDSGINNLQRFTEIQFEEKPYKLKSYSQNELVKANNYQGAETYETLNLLKGINKRIISIIKNQDKQTLNYKIITDNKKTFNLKFLIEDYVCHFEHHVKQIVE